MMGGVLINVGEKTTSCEDSDKNGPRLCETEELEKPKVRVATSGLRGPSREPVSLVLGRKIAVENPVACEA